jgi:hypothetical protein
MSQTPDTLFGICPRCNADGGDYAVADLDNSANNTDVDVSGNGVPLEYYDGKLMCELCVKRYIADEETKVSNRKQAEEERFRAKAGFTTTV